MKSKKLLRMFVPAAFIAALSFPGSAFAEDQHNLSLSLFTPSANAANQTLNKWAKELKEESDGRLNIQFFPSGQMGPPQRQFDLARTGASDMAWFIHGFTPGRFPATEAAYLPGLFRTSKMGSVAMMSGAEEFLADEHQGVKILAVAYSTPLSVFTIKDEVKTPTDLSGKRLRHPGAPIADTIRALNAAPVAVPPPEMGEALSRGIVDGIVTNYEAADALSILGDLSYATDPGIGSVTFALVMNRDTYNDLPSDLRSLLDKASGVPLSEKLGKAFDESEAQAKEGASGITNVELTKEQQSAFDEVFAEDISARLKSGSDGRAFYDFLKERAKSQ